MDLFSRKIVGWAMRDHMLPNCLNGLTMAIKRQRPGRDLSTIPIAACNMPQRYRMRSSAGIQHR